LANSRPNAVGIGPAMLTASPDRLVRTMEGRIISWSPGMQRRYGFTRKDACGQSSHQLLKTTFPQTLQEIEAMLVHRNSWRGGLIHRHADGSAVMAANHWHVHRNSGDQGCLVTEVHSNIAQVSEGVYHELADVLSAMAHELGEPLTAISNCFDEMQQAYRGARLASESMARSIEQTSSQITRSAGGVLLLRYLANQVRNIGSMPDGSARTSVESTPGQRSVSP
jgi:signal transduction histidine kinase